MIRQRCALYSMMGGGLFYSAMQHDGGLFYSSTLFWHVDAPNIAICQPYSVVVCRRRIKRHYSSTTTGEPTSNNTLRLA